MAKPIIKKEDIDNPFSVIHNFDVSVVIPFYKKIREFKRVLPANAPFFQRNGIEIILSMDEDSEMDEVIHFIKEYSFINWRVIVNHKKHAWRNPVKAINVGVKHASKKHVMVCSPESEFETDAIYLMRNALEHYQNHFVIGSVAFVHGFNKCDGYKAYLPYGSIMVKRSDLAAIGGYDESLSLWGGDDDNVRARLEMSGVEKMYLQDVKLIHREKDSDGMSERREKRSQIPIEMELEIYYPNTHIVNQKGWGQDYNHVVYDWRNNQYAHELAEKYLSKFEAFHLSNQFDVFSKSYSRILITQTFNEESRIVEYLNNMAKHFDGILLLDDGSNDKTYELATHPKVLLKVKKIRTDFNDIENRNTCLDLASFFNCEWFCFMDTDEEFDERFCDFNTVTSNPDSDIVIFRNINLWDSPLKYNSEYPFSENGIMYKKRMFRNIGHSQIYTSKKRYHFDVTPYHTNFLISAILYKHYGMLNKESRQKKYLFYEKTDTEKDQTSYEHLLADNPLLLEVDDISLSPNGHLCNKKLHNEFM
ncbi:MAG: glycosyltransferase family 2 protein [Paludibacteraceae bacterium]